MSFAGHNDNVNNSPIPRQNQVKLMGGGAGGRGDLAPPPLFPANAM